MQKSLGIINLLKQKYYSELTLVNERSNTGGNKKKTFSQNTFEIDDISGIIFFINIKKFDE